MEQGKQWTWSSRRILLGAAPWRFRRGRLPGRRIVGVGCCPVHRGGGRDQDGGRRGREELAEWEVAGGHPPSAGIRCQGACTLLKGGSFCHNSVKKPCFPFSFSTVTMSRKYLAKEGNRKAQNKKPEKGKANCIADFILFCLPSVVKSSHLS